jgi:hypothetical protein
MEKLGSTIWVSKKSTVWNEVTHHDHFMQLREETI